MLSAVSVESGKHRFECNVVTGVCVCVCACACVRACVRVMVGR